MRRTIILHPYVTEKTMNAMSGTPNQDLKDGNRLEFVVRMDSTKPDIKKAFEEKFQAKVDKINIKIMRDGKHAIIKLKEGYSAEDIGMRIGIF
jgi:large subunit ribosomal protein L23